MRIALIANTTWYLYNFRMNLMRELIASGHEVVAIGPPDTYVDKFVEAGIQHYPIALVGSSVNPIRESRTVYSILSLLRKESIELVLSYTPKGNIYSALAATIVGIPTIPNVSGLGQVFIGNSPLTWLVKQLYRHVMGRATWVFFQNLEDFAMFDHLGLVDSSRMERIPGSGVDVSRFSQDAEPSLMKRKNSFVLLLVARLIWEKGVGEFVAAAREVKKEFPSAEFQLLGFLDEKNPSSIPRNKIIEWENEGVVRYLGSTDDVVPFIRDADCIVLPSFYREGVPRALLEAAAMSKPIITTDAPGCRDTVDDEVTGFLCNPRDADNLAGLLLRLINMPVASRQQMGLLGREKMLREFDEKIVINRYLSIINNL